MFDLWFYQPGIPVHPLSDLIKVPPQPRAHACVLCVCVVGAWWVRCVVRERWATVRAVCADLPRDSRREQRA
jgi:hypothetical protein